MPSDLVGTRIWRPDTGRFDTELGPVFGNFLLADEINRAPAKVQSALLEVMQEQQVTIGGETFPVPTPFLVLATQNPIESEGTYPLPEAQIDRFLMKVLVDYPSVGEEAAVVGRSLAGVVNVRERVTLDDLERSRGRRTRCTSTVGHRLRRHARDATRTPERYGLGELEAYVEYGRARAGRSGSCAPPAPWRCCAVASTSSWATSATSPPMSCATASCSPTTRSATG